MQLILKPFTKLEYERKYNLHRFIEDGKPFSFLSRRSQSRINSGNKYKFGLIDKEGKFHWLFYGQVVCRDRVKALETYSALLKLCKAQKLGEPFAYKE
tara:strand:+ start:80 stop:373 length:294 start_codon:yes stop_codon:yes gene_type:complete